MAKPKKRKNAKRKRMVDTMTAPIAKPKPAPHPHRVETSFGTFLLHVFLALTALCLGSIAPYLYEPSAWAGNTTGGLLGEILLHSHATAHEFADRSIQEALDLWSEPTSNWQTMFNTTRLAKNQVTVECRRVSEGSFRESGVHLARSNAVLRGATAKQVYDFMLSPEGFAIFDRLSNRSDFYRSIEPIPGWREGGGKTEIAELRVSGLGPFSDRHFLVLSSTIPVERILVAKSIVHPSRPGASPFYEGKESKESNDKRVRSVGTFAIKVDSKILSSGEEVVVVKMINYINLFFLHEGLMSFASCKWLLPNLYRDFQLAFDAKRHLQKK